jgi:hypothetical protein
MACKLGLLLGKNVRQTLMRTVERPHNGLGEQNNVHLRPSPRWFSLDTTLYKHGPLILKAYVLVCVTRRGTQA